MKLKTLIFATITMLALLSSTAHAGDGYDGYVVFNAKGADSITSPLDVLVKSYYVANGVKHTNSSWSARFRQNRTWLLLGESSQFIAGLNVSEEGVSLWRNGHKISNCSATISSGTSISISSQTTRTLTMLKDADGNYSCRVS